MTNPAYEGYVKIGSTGNGKSSKTVEERRKELSRPEGVMFPFEIYAYYETDVDVADKSIHELIDTINPKLRANKRREFYKMTPHMAYSILEKIAKIHNATDKLVLVDEHETSTKIKAASKRPAFNFVSAQIPIGSELTYIEDEDVKVKVVDERKAEYKGEITTVSPLATQLLGSKRPVQGTLYFTYEGEILSDRRARLEAEGMYK